MTDARAKFLQANERVAVAEIAEALYTLRHLEDPHQSAPWCSASAGVRGEWLEQVGGLLGALRGIVDFACHLEERRHG